MIFILYNYLRIFNSEVLFMSNEVEVWKSANKAAKELGINNSNLYRHLRGINKTCGGYRWEYVNK